MPVIGTAGHVDHGKSTLIEALTGRDPDRLAEEKRRGLTIDLGFAWTHLESDLEVGFVDVPGHERFIKNMLAGIEAVQAVLFVVAADEGWMPQSEEHLAVIDLLDIRYGVVALTRVDLVDDDGADLAVLEIEDRLADTSLAQAPIVRVAAPAGKGVDELRAALAQAVRESPPVPDENRPRLWVDRSFVIAGSGTVVTGTLAGGRLQIGDQVTVWPGSHTGRVRGLQSHERASDEALPGTRTAINISGVETAQIARGAMLGRDEHWLPSAQFLAEVAAVRAHPDALGDRGAFHVHLGSGSWPAVVRLVGDQAGVQLALIRLADLVPVAMGDRFVLRETGRRAVVGGGRVIEPAPVGRPWTTAPVIEGLLGALEAGPDQRADALLEARRHASVAALTAHSGGGRPSTGLFAGASVLAAGMADELLATAVHVVAGFHEANPMRPGIPKASLAEQLGVSLVELEVLLPASSGLVADGTVVRTADFAAALDAGHEEAWEEARAILSKAGLAVPRAGSLGLGLELIHALERAERLVMVTDDLVYLPEQIARIHRTLSTLGDDFTVAEFRDALGVTRRHAVPLLEWLDANGITVRHGDVRRVRESSAAEQAPDDARPQ